MVTIYDVAREAGVSPKTVSRVLNGDAPVGARTRKLVDAAITSLGYVPSPAARSMRSNRSGIVGLITGAISHHVSDVSDAEPSGLPDLFIVQAIQKGLAASTKTLMIADTGADIAAVPGLIETFRRHRVEGLIYVAEYHSAVAIENLDPDLPTVLVNCFDEAGTPSVVPDDRAGQRELVSALIEAGHRRIAYLTLVEGIVATTERSAGYREALSAAGIAFDPDLLGAGQHYEGDISSRKLAALIDRLLALDTPPTAICCGNDKMAIQVYGVLRARGVAVPQDISIAGFDDYRLIAEALYPPLTTAQLPYAQMGARAAERLLSLISGKDTAPAKEAVPGRVVWRGSVTRISPGGAAAHHATSRFQGRNL